GIAKLFVDGKALTSFGDGLTSGFFWSADSQRVYFPRAGDLWQAPVAGGAPTAVWTTPETETNITPSPDRRRVAFVRSGAVVIRSLADGKEIVAARSDQPVRGISWTPDGRNVVLNAGAETIRHEQTPPYSGVKIIYTIAERRGGETFIVPAAGGASTRVARAGGFGGLRWLDATHWVADRTQD